MMARNNRERVKIEHRRSRVADLALKGWTQVDIALELSVSQATVSNDIKACRQEWKEQRIRDTDAVIDEESRRLLMVLREALSGWEASNNPSKRPRFPSSAIVGKWKRLSGSGRVIHDSSK